MGRRSAALPLLPLSQIFATSSPSTAHVRASTSSISPAIDCQPGRSASNTSRSLLEWAPKCPCGYGYMILKTSRTAHNPGQRFWKCPDLHGERGCGLFIWMDEVAPEYTADRNMRSEQTESRIKEMKTLLEEMKQEIEHEIQILKESIEA